MENTKGEQQVSYLKRYSDVCRETTRIESKLFDEYEVKRGLRDKNGDGVLSGLTNISKIKSKEVIQKFKDFKNKIKIL